MTGPFSQELGVNGCYRREYKGRVGPRLVSRALPCFSMFHSFEALQRVLEFGLVLAVDLRLQMNFCRCSVSPVVKNLPGCVGAPSIFRGLSLGLLRCCVATRFFVPTAFTYGLRVFALRLISSFLRLSVRSLSCYVAARFFDLTALRVGSVAVYFSVSTMFNIRMCCIVVARVLLLNVLRATVLTCPSMDYVRSSISSSVSLISV